MSEQFKTLVAYVVGVSILMFAWSVFRTWEPPLPLRGGVATETALRPGSSHGIAPTRVAAE
jgi:hypothetical protein